MIERNLKRIGAKLFISDDGERSEVRCSGTEEIFSKAMSEAGRQYQTLDPKNVTSCVIFSKSQGHMQQATRMFWQSPGCAAIRPVKWGNVF